MKTQSLHPNGDAPDVIYHRTPHLPASLAGVAKKLILARFLACHRSHVAKLALDHMFYRSNVHTLVLHYAMQAHVHLVNKWARHKVVFAVDKKSPSVVLILTMSTVGAVVKFVAKRCLVVNTCVNDVVTKASVELAKYLSRQGVIAGKF